LNRPTNAISNPTFVSVASLCGVALFFRMQYINFNGQIIDANTPIFTTKNRAFRYGDALFESIRMVDGQLPFLRYHYERMRRGMEVLGLDIPTHFSIIFFENEIKKLTRNKGNYRIRLTVYRNDGGLYTPQNNMPIFLIEAKQNTDNQFTINEKGAEIGIYKDFKLPLSPLANLKTSNSLPYVLAAQFCKKNMWDDCLILNQAGRIAETYKANIFFAKNDVIYTPSLDEGCIDGVMRKVVINILREMKKEIIEAPISPEKLNEFDAIFITNATRGVQWISRIIGLKNYEKIFVDEIVERLNRKTIL